MENREREISNQSFETKTENYVNILKPLFFPENPVENNIIHYFSSLLRVFGMEDSGWDPYAESRALLNDFNGLFSFELPQHYFPEASSTYLRLDLLLYGHIVEMDAPYDVLANLLRFQLGKGYSPIPFSDLLSKRKLKNVSVKKKIVIISALSRELGYCVGDIFTEFYDNHLRNAVAHSDYILADDSFRRFFPLPRSGRW